MNVGVKHTASKTVKSIHADKMDETESAHDYYLKIEPKSDQCTENQPKHFLYAIQYWLATDKESETN